MSEKAEEKPDVKKVGEGQGQAGIVRAVASPLNFFALIALLTNGIAGATAVLAHLSEPHVFIVVLLMLAVLISLTALVGYITVFRPRNLSPEMAKALESSSKALKISEEVQSFLTSDAFQDAVRDVIEHSNPLAAAEKPLLEIAATAVEDMAEGEGNHA